MSEITTLEWNESEGYEIRYSELARQYGLAVPFREACSKVPSMISDLVARGENAARQAAEIEKKKSEYQSQIENLVIALERERAELDTQRSHNAIEPKPEYRNRIDMLEANLRNREPELERMRSYLATPTPEGGLSASDASSLVALMKFSKYMGSKVTQHVEVPRLEPRNKGHAIPLDTNGYAGVLESFLATDVETVFYFDGNLIFSEPEFETADWGNFRQIGLEVVETLKRGKRRARAMNGRLFIRYNADFYCGITALAIREPVTYGHFDIAMLHAREKQQHPVFNDFAVYTPQSFVLFNDTLLVRHDFQMVRTTIASAMFKKSFDYDDE